MKFTSVKKWLILFTFTLFTFAALHSICAHSIVPSFFQGTEQVPIADLIQKVEKKPKNENSAFDLALLHQTAYGRKMKYLTGEKYIGVGTDYEFLYFPGIPARLDRKKIVPAKDPEEEKIAKAHLKEAIRYFTQVIDTKKPYAKISIGGLSSPEEALNILQTQSYWGLIQCLRESGEDDKARALYAPMMKKASEVGITLKSMPLQSWSLISESPPVNPELKPKFQDLEEISPKELTDRWNQVALSKKTPFSIWQAQADLLVSMALQKTEDI
jgi:hypothetical protein